jgi:phosphatidate phosphatase APP1
MQFGCRVLSKPLGGGPKADDGWWDNLLNSYRRWNSAEVGGVTVKAHIDGQTFEQTADEEGYVWFDVQLPSEPGGGYWHVARLEVEGEAAGAGGGEGAEGAEGCHPSALGASQVTAECGVVCPKGDAQFGIISDMDDTVLHTSITSLLTAAKLTFLSNAHTRQPLAGVGALYRALVGGDVDALVEPRNPLFYVSSSPWNLYDLLHDFLEVNRIPAGPLRLRDLGVDETKLFKSKGHGHKLVKARAIMDDYSELPFVLFGDSGQADAELYAELAQERPGQIKAIFIRDVDPGREDERDVGVAAKLADAESAGVPAMLIGDSTAAARKLAELGLLEGGLVPAIEAAVRVDAEQPTVSEAGVP